MDFSHVVSFPEPHDQPEEVQKAILNKLPEEHVNQVFGQSAKLKKLYFTKTKQMVYVLLDSVSVPTPKKLQHRTVHSVKVGDYCLEEFNAMAGVIPITLVSNVANSKQVYLNTCKKHNIVSNIKEFISIPGHNIAYCLAFIGPWPNRPAVPSMNCNHLFSITNGKPKLPRIMLMEELWNRKLLDSAIWSWHRSEFAGFEQLGWLMGSNVNFPFEEEKSLDDITWSDELPLEKQTPPKIHPGYDDCYFEAMVESMQEPDGIYCTEKTWRSYLYLKPSLQLNYYGHYEYLKSAGIELYTDIFDYNIVEQPTIDKRIKGIADNLARLKDMDQTTLDDLIINNTDQMIHNRNVIMNTKPEDVGNPELQYLLDHNIVPNDLNTPQRLKAIGQKWV